MPQGIRLQPSRPTIAGPCGSQASKLLNKTQNACSCVQPATESPLDMGSHHHPAWPHDRKKAGPTTRRIAQPVAPRATATAGTTTEAGNCLFFSIVSSC